MACCASTSWRRPRRPRRPGSRRRSSITSRAPWSCASSRGGRSRPRISAGGRCWSASCRWSGAAIVEVPKHLRGPVLVFWVFHVLRDYGHALREGGSKRIPLLPRLLGIAADLERRSGRSTSCFGHNDLLARQFHRRRRAPLAHRLGLCRFQLARSSTSPISPPTTSWHPRTRSGCSRATSRGTVEPDCAARYAAMKCASLLREAMWSMVSEIHSTLDFDYAAYTRGLSRPLRARFAAPPV